MAYVYDIVSIRRMLDSGPEDFRPWEREAIIWCEYAENKQIYEEAKIAWAELGKEYGRKFRLRRTRTDTPGLLMYNVYEINPDYRKGE